MCRFIFLVILVILLICGIGSVFGEDVLLWIMLVGVVGAPLGLLLLPKRGDQYAFQNLYRRLALILLIAIVVIFIAGFYIMAMFLQKDSPEWLSTVAALGILAFGLLATFVVVRPYYPPTYKLRWIRKHFPEVFKAIQSYKKRTEALEDYTPCLIVGDARYFLVEFYGRGLRDNSRSLLVIDEHGKPTHDEQLFQKASQCKALAMNTIDYGNFNGRAQAITNANQAFAGIKEIIEILRQEAENIIRHSKESAEDLEKIFAAVEPIRLFTEATISILMLQAKWSKDHGLSKLTTVEYGEVVHIIETIQLEREESVAHYATITAAAEPANRLAKVMEEIPFHVSQKKMVIEGLLGISDMGKGLVGHEVYEYALPTDADWQAWRDGLAWADQVDAGAEG